MITSNLVFSKWDQIFKDTMTTAAAIDRVVHHSVILELTNSKVPHLTAKLRAGVNPVTTTFCGKAEEIAVFHKK